MKIRMILPQYWEYVFVIGLGNKQLSICQAIQNVETIWKKSKNVSGEKFCSKQKINGIMKRLNLRTRENGSHLMFLQLTFSVLLIGFRIYQLYTL